MCAISSSAGDAKPIKNLLTADGEYVSLTYVSGGKTYTTAKVGDTTTFKNGSYVVQGTAGTGETALGLTLSPSTIDDGATIYLTVTNAGTNEVVQSNSIKFHTIG